MYTCVVRKSQGNISFQVNPDTKACEAQLLSPLRYFYDSEKARDPREEEGCARLSAERVKAGVDKIMDEINVSCQGAYIHKEREREREKERERARARASEIFVITNI
jgi:hypothetical protein